MVVVMTVEEVMVERDGADDGGGDGGEGPTGRAVLVARGGGGEPAGEEAIKMESSWR